MLIDHSDNPSWDHVRVSDRSPEMATSAEWRAAAVAARKSRKMSQREIATRLGTSQNMVSLIESGEVVSSSYILPMSRVLGIPPPQHYESDDHRQWAELGQLLRQRDRRVFRRALALVEELVKGDEHQQSTDDDATVKPRK